MNPKVFKRILLPALLLALCFLWASWLGASESPGEASVMLGRPAVIAEATRDAAPLIAPRGRVEAHPPASEELAASDLTTSEPPVAPLAFDMTLRGTLFDYDGEPAPRRRLSICREDASGREIGFAVTSNASGEFQCSIGPGRWRARCQGSEGLCHVDLGDVLIPEVGEVAYHDLFLPGNRKLFGGFHRPDADEAYLEVEVFDRTDLTRVVATAGCSTSETEYAAWADHVRLHQNGEGEEDDQPPPTHPRGRGIFEIDGLAPSYYEIRVYMDVGKRFFVSGEVDLTDGDHECPEFPLVQADFLSHRRLDL